MQPDYASVAAGAVASFLSLIPGLSFDASVHRLSRMHGCDIIEPHSPDLASRTESNLTRYPLARLQAAMAWAGLAGQAWLAADAADTRLEPGCGFSSP
jgi:hypothetical protein